MKQLGIIAALSLAACGDSAGPPPPGPPLAVIAGTPAPSATDAETGTSVSVTFNQPINPATLTDATFRVTVAGVALPAALSYDAPTHTARAVVPLLPGVAYGVEVTPGVRTLADSALPAPKVWNFTTRTWQALAVDTPGFVGVTSALVLDGTARRHVTYFGDAGFTYATCAAACGTLANWQVGLADTVGTIVGQHGSLAVDGTGRLHALYKDGELGNLKYATCPANCTVNSNWQTATLDTAGNVGGFTSLEVGANGRLHASYRDDLNANLRYATCATNCAAQANWQFVTVGAAGTVGAYTSLAVGGSGRLHITYRNDEFDALAYATCSSGCNAAGNWRRGEVDEPGVGTTSSVGVDASGRVHVTYYDLTNLDLKYATCLASCTVMTNWQSTVVDTAGDVGEFGSLFVDGRGRLHVGYHDATNGDLKYATCATACTTAANWRTIAADAAGNVGTDVSLLVDGSGRVMMSYRDQGNFNLKYIE